MPVGSLWIKPRLILKSPLPLQLSILPAVSHQTGCRLSELLTLWPTRMSK